jgi:hypothetical protein
VQEGHSPPQWALLVQHVTCVQLETMKLLPVMPPAIDSVYHVQHVELETMKLLRVPIRRIQCVQLLQVARLHLPVAAARLHPQVAAARLHPQVAAARLLVALVLLLVSDIKINI